MPNRRIARVILLGCLITVLVGLASQLTSSTKILMETAPKTASATSAAVAQRALQFKINTAGALQSLLNSQAKVLLGGAGYEVRDGYVLRYATPKSKKLIYAVGTQQKGVKGEGKASPVGSLVKARAQTTDGVLEISSEYELDAQQNQLSIIRKIQNLSDQPVTLTLVQNYVEPGLFAESGTSYTPPVKNNFLPQANLGRLINLVPWRAGRQGFTPGGGGDRPTKEELFRNQIVRLGRGSMLPSNDCSGCDSKPPCPGCLGRVEEFVRCVRCTIESQEDPVACCEVCNCSAGDSQEKRQVVLPEALVMGNPVGLNVYYDAVLNFISPKGSLVLQPMGKSASESRNSRVYLLVQIKLLQQWK